MSVKTAIGLMFVFFLVATSGEAQAGHCRAGWSRDRIKCLNSEVAYLTAKQRQTQRNLDALKADIPKRVSAAFPAGTIITWFSKEERPPKGWELCDGKDGRPDLNGLWVVGTDKPSEVGMVVNQDPVNIPITTGAAEGGHNWAWGDTETETPHATGTDHFHKGSIAVSDRSSLAPPSMKVRYIIKVE
jgi:hypothetical protein